MALRNLRPTTPGQRGASVPDFEEITRQKPEKSLVRPINSKGGRNATGRVTMRHQGGGHKRAYRLIDFVRNDKDGIPAKVAQIEYDPNRNARIALVTYSDGEKCYILHPVGLNVGDSIITSPDANISVGNCLPLKNIPLGTEVHNVELQPGGGGQLVRSAGTVAQIVAKENNLVTLRLPSGEVRLISQNCWATIGRVGNVEFSNLTLGKAGRRRWLGYRPHVRGSAMNPVDHPHGGGEGRAPIGRSRPVSPWGKPALGSKTRKAKKWSTKYIVQKRK